MEDAAPRGSQIVADFNQVEVRVSDVNRKHVAQGAVACHRHKFDGVVTGVQMRDYFIERGLCDEAQVPRSRSRMHCLWLELLPRLVKVDFLFPKSERLSISERNQFHAQGGGVKRDSCVDTGDGEDEMVEMIDNESHTHTLIE
jgi:hypothetical protein